MAEDTIVRREIAPYLPARIAEAVLAWEEEERATITEIRLRCGRKIILRCGLREVILETVCSAEELRRIVQILCRHSRYSVGEELRSGYLTMAGGHRVGLAGRAVAEQGRVEVLKYISSLVIRVARQVPGCAGAILPYIRREDGSIRNTLLVAPPYSGKTTLLRDLVRLISDGGLQVGLADERSEIAGCREGVPTLDVGLRTDVLCDCPKAEAILMLVRAMSPQVIATDELGRREDIAAVEEAIPMGIGILATMHGRSRRDVEMRLGRPWTDVARLFETVVFLDNEPAVGSIRSVESVRQGAVCSCC